MNYIDELYDLIQLEAIDNARNRKDFSNYSHNDIPVPRVTKIISDCMNSEWLIKWACNLGWYNYLREKDFATSVGTKVHEMIEHFLKTGEDLEINFKKLSKQGYVIEKAYNNFKTWYNNLLANGNTLEILGLEVPVACPYYAGTIDCLCKINNAIYIIDFKTSKKIGYDYLIQVCAYKWLIDNGYCNLIQHVDGVGIIRVDKENYTYDDLFLNEFNSAQNQIINYYIQGFMSILTTYYNKINMEYQFNQYKKQYPGIDSVINNVIDM